MVYVPFGKAFTTQMLEPLFLHGSYRNRLERFVTGLIYLSVAKQYRPKPVGKTDSPDVEAHCSKTLSNGNRHVTLPGFQCSRVFNSSTLAYSFNPS